MPRKTSKNRRFFLNAQPANWVTRVIKSAVYPKWPWQEENNMQVNVRECQYGPEHCSRNSECRWNQKTCVQWLLEISCWKCRGNRAPKSQGPRVFGKWESDFPPDLSQKVSMPAFSLDLPAHVSIPLLDVNRSSLHVRKSWLLLSRSAVQIWEKNFCP